MERKQREKRGLPPKVRNTRSDSLIPTIDETVRKDVGGGKKDNSQGMLNKGHPTRNGC